jgi:thiosulfate reductase cytochrome b subunit
MALFRHVDFRALAYGITTGRFRQKLFPISIREILATVGDALRFKLGHDDLTHYNAVQKILYLGIILIGILIVVSGLALWKPIQFSELASLFGSFQTIRLVHFLCMSAIVLFLIVHVALALLVPKSLVAMLSGGPIVRNDAMTVADAARTPSQ